MSEIKPITTVYGGYPHSEERILSERDPHVTYGMLRQNLKWLLGSRMHQYYSESIIPQDRRGRKRLQKLISQGWMVETAVPRALLRGATYTFKRPVVTPEEEEFLGWK